MKKDFETIRIIADEIVRAAGIGFVTFGLLIMFLPGSKFGNIFAAVLSIITLGLCLRSMLLIPRLVRFFSRWAVQHIGWDKE